MQKITPFLWFDDNAEEAAHFYVSIFPNSKIVGRSRYGDAGPGPTGQVLTVPFEIAGQRLTALNGGPRFKFTEAVSFVVDVENQAELDTVWNKLIAGGGEPSQCGWLKDKFGLSWQVVPTILPELMQHNDPANANRVMQALLKMSKLDIKALQDAAAG